MRKDVKEFIRMLQGKGWFFQRNAGTGHVVMRYKPGGQIAVPRTPSDYRWQLNCQSDARKVEAKYGKWFELKVGEGEQISDKRGLDYGRPETVECVIHERIDEWPEVTIVEPKQGEYQMSTLDKELIIELLETKFESLRKVVEPYLNEFHEYTRVKKTLDEMKRAFVSDEQKMGEYLSNAAPKKLVIASPSIIKVRGRVRSEDFYNDAKQIVISNAGRMNVEELCEWLCDVKGYNLGYPEGNHPRTPIVDMVQRIRVYNDKFPAQARLFLGPEKEEGAKRIKRYEYVTYRENLHVITDGNKGYVL